MNIELALRNFDILKNLPEGTRLYASRDGTLSYDTRWFVGARRRLDGSSREDIYLPINKSFITLCVEQKKTNDEMVECIEHLRNRFMKLYPDGDPNAEKVHKFLNYLQSFVVNFNVNTLDCEKSRSNDVALDLLDKVIQEIADEKAKIRGNIESPSSEGGDLRSAKALRSLPQSPIENISQVTSFTDELQSDDSTSSKIYEITSITVLGEPKPMTMTEYDAYYSSLYPDRVSDMDNTDTDDDMPPLISDSEDEDDTHTHNIYVSQQTCKSIEQCINRFEEEVREKILPKLENETERIINSMDVNINRVTTQLIRRFVLNNKQDSNVKSNDYDDDNGKTKGGYINDQGECIYINIPSIPLLYSSDDDDSDHTHTHDHEPLFSDEETFNIRGCLDKLIEDIEDDFKNAVKSTSEMCNNISRFVSRFL